MTTKTVYGYSDRQCIINIYISGFKIFEMGGWLFPLTGGYAYMPVI